MQVPRPGDVIERELEERGWSLEDLARKSDLDLDLVTQVVEEDRSITRDIAKALGQAFGTSADLWYQMNRTYRWWLRDTPPETVGWLNPELRTALDAIEKPHVAKKRATVLLLAIATATDTPWTEVFDDPRVCNQRIWYQKWQHDPAISGALELATERALHWRDQETAAIEAQAAQMRRRAIAEGSLDAVDGLRETAKRNRDGDGIKASEVLLTLSDEDLAARLAGMASGAIPVEVEGLDDLIAAELERVADGGQGRAIAAAEGDADGGE
jgi:plasmid maintenance system antidote protein VapI